MKSHGNATGNGDHEVGCSKPQQAENNDLALPPWKQFLEDENAALTVRAHGCVAAVHRQRAERRQQHEDERRDGRERAGREERDTRLIRERHPLIQPVVNLSLHGVRSRTPAYRVLYSLTAPLLPVLRRIMPGPIPTTDQMDGRAMLIVARRGAPKPILENRDINAPAPE